MNAAGDSTQAFLAGQPIGVDPRQIEPTLHALWHPAAEATEHGDELPPVTRVSLGTQVLLAGDDVAEELQAAWSEVAERFPSRAVLVLLGDGPGLTAAVSAACHLPQPGQPQVCSERILLRAGLGETDLLPGSVLPLLEPDVPATLWWHLPTAPSEAMVERLCRQVDRCLVDLTYSLEPEQTLSRLHAAGSPPLADLAWYRAGRWREGIARLFDGPNDVAALRAVDLIEVAGAAGREGQQLPAALLAAWIAGRLRWLPAARHSDAESLWTRSDGLPARLRLRRVPTGDERPGRLQAVTLQATALDSWYRLERLRGRPRELRVEAHQADRCALPTVMPAPRPRPVEVLLDAVSAPPRNPVRDQSLQLAAWILGWAENVAPSGESHGRHPDPRPPGSGGC